MADQLTEAQLLEILRSRGSTYSLLSHVFRREVAASFLAEVVDQLRAEPAEDGESEGYTTLRAYVAMITGSDLEKARTDLAADYAALFLNMGPRPVFPFESVYTSPDRLLMQKARDEVLADYRSEGLERVDAFHEPEDHVSIELEFMAYLCQKAAEATEAEDRAGAKEALQKQLEFLKRHLLVWVPEFCKDVQRAARTGFYKGVAQIAGEYLAMEPDTVDELLAAMG